MWKATNSQVYECAVGRLRPSTVEKECPLTNSSWDLLFSSLSHRTLRTWTFITISAKPSLSASSVEQVQVEGSSCVWFREGTTSSSLRPPPSRARTIG